MWQISPLWTERPGKGAGARTLLRLLLILCAAALAAGCGLIFDGKDHGSQKPQDKPLAGEDSTAQPLPYEVRFVVLQDGQELPGGSSAEPGKDQAGETAGTSPAAPAAGGRDGKDSPGQKDASDGKSPAAPASGTAAQDTGGGAPAAGTPDGSQGSEGKSAGREGAKPARDSHAAGLAGRMEGLSQLVSLRKKPPDGELGLEMRARKDVETARKLMASEGYYEGDAGFTLEGTDTDKAKVTISLRPGPRYVIGDITVVYAPRPKIPERISDKKDEIFVRHSLDGIRAGEPATAKELLDSVQMIPVRLKQNAYPDARVVQEYYYLDKEKRTLNALIEVAAGEPAVMGRPVFQGESDVNPEYLEKLIHWKPGEQLWDQRRLDNYVTQLRRTGLFQQVSVVDMPGREGADGETVGAKPVGIRLEDARHRTLGAQLRYDTDTGLGAEVEWEHRNLFGNGEKLTLTAPYTATARGLKAAFNKPAFFGEHQVLELQGSALDETTDAYDRTGVMLSAGVRRYWSRQFSTKAGVMADMGTLKELDKERTAYSLYSIPLSGRWDTRDNRLNPVKGHVAELSLKPMTGEYNGDFTALGSTLKMSGYWAPFRDDKGNPSDSLVFAGQVGLGSITGAETRNLPSTQRYYMGGMETVRGYGYQQVGPMDKNGDPVGGRSYQLVNLESRFKVAKDVGLVAFLDGGQLYSEEWPEFDTDMDWGAGIGVRYFTPIGPVRFDLAFPLKDVDPPVQFYISIGQSF